MTEQAVSDHASIILVVDDDADWRALLKDSLEQAGFQVFEESRGDRVLPAAERHRPDVVVLDQHMPGIDGLEAIAQLRDRWPVLPVLLTSSFAEPWTIARALALGARYVDKSFHPATVVTEVARLSGGKMRR